MKSLNELSSYLLSLGTYNRVVGDVLLLDDGISFIVRDDSYVCRKMRDGKNCETNSAYHLESALEIYHDTRQVVTAGDA